MLRNFNEEQLKFILNASSVEEIQNQLNISDDDCQQMTSRVIKMKLNKLKKDNASACIVSEALEDSSSIFTPLWMAFSFFTVCSLFFLSLITAGLMLVTFMGASLYYQRKNKESIREQVEDIQLLSLKMLAFDKILQQSYQYTPRNAAPAFTLAPIRTPLRESINVGVGASSLLFGTFYWGVTDLLVALSIGAAGILTGGIAFGVALGVSIIIGAGVAFKHYKTKKYENVRESYRNVLMDNVKRKSAMYEVCRDKAMEAALSSRKKLCANQNEMKYPVEKKEKNINSSYHSEKWIKNSLFSQQGVSSPSSIFEPKILKRRAMSF